jgi:uncharacterized protein DUF11
MRLPGISRIALVVAFVGSLAGCHHSDTTTAPGALANVTVTGPSSVTAGQNFDVDVAATAVGVNNVQNGLVTVTIPAPLTITSTSTSNGTNATVSGNTVTWNLGTLDANSQSTLHVNLMGVLPPGSNAQSATIQAQLTGNSINPGDATASMTIQVNP